MSDETPAQQQETTKAPAPQPEPAERKVAQPQNQDYYRKQRSVDEATLELQRLQKQALSTPQGLAMDLLQNQINNAALAVLNAEAGLASTPVQEEEPEYADDVLYGLHTKAVVDKTLQKAGQTLNDEICTILNKSLNANDESSFAAYDLATTLLQDESLLTDQPLQFTSTLHTQLLEQFGPEVGGELAAVANAVATSYYTTEQAFSWLTHKGLLNECLVAAKSGLLRLPVARPRNNRR